MSRLWSNEITAPNAGGPRQLAMQTRWAARVGLFRRSLSFGQAMSQISTGFQSEHAYELVAVTPLIGIASRESSGWALAFFTIFGGPILLLLMFELAFGRAIDRTKVVRRQESPREYWLLLLFHLLLLLFVVGFILFYFFYYSS